MRMSVELYDELKHGERFDSPVEEEPRCCSICDGMGHGYPGGGPCPLENTMSDADVMQEEAEYRQNMMIQEQAALDRDERRQQAADWCYGPATWGVPTLARRRLGDEEE